MGSVDLRFASDLRDRLALTRAVETGTFRGVTARALAGVFPTVVTIELAAELHARAVTSLSDLSGVTALQGHSAQRLGEIADAGTPTLYFLDGHWSGGMTEGVNDECPVLEEIEAIGSGHPDDCLIVDDARLFTSAPAPPHRAEQWPTLIELFDAIRARRPEHHVTLLDDQVIAVPMRARAAADAHGLRAQAAAAGALHVRAAAALAAVRARLRR